MPSHTPLAAVGWLAVVAALLLLATPIDADRPCHRRSSQFSALHPLPPSPSSALPLSSSIASLSSLSVVLSNDAPRRDVNGRVMDIHDGNILLHNSTYYYYGASYGDCAEPKGSEGCSEQRWGASCGFFLNHNVSLYTSTDLVRWHPAPQPVFQMQRDFNQSAVLFSPKVLYNPTTQLWVLWFNYNLNITGGFYGTATSPSPFGPFTVRVAPVASLVYKGPSDSAVWQDPVTHQGYIVYSGEFKVSVEAMTADYLQTLGKANSSGPVGPLNVEAPAFFKRGSTYYLSTGSLCCYCKQGSTAIVYAASNPLGPYTAQTKLSQAMRSQQTDITRFIDGEGQEQFLYRGDGWQQSMDGLKSHDPTFVALLQFDTNGTVQPLTFQPAFRISVQVPAGDMTREGAVESREEKEVQGSRFK